jgi:hypothetical protein
VDLSPTGTVAFLDLVERSVVGNLVAARCVGFARG